MKIRESFIKGVFEIIPNVFGDDRGYFFESYNKGAFDELGVDINFVQDNQSYSQPGVLRGLHFQLAPSAQGKLVRVAKGKVLDVAVDLRPGSPTFGKYDAVVLNEKEKNLFWIPPGFAHGFMAIEESLFLYKCSNLYDKAAEGGIIWNDPDLNIDWGIKEPLVSEKDQILPSFKYWKENQDKLKW